MKYVLTVLLIISSFIVKSQVLTTTIVDPCDGKITTVTVPLANGAVTVVYRGAYRVVTADDITTGALQAWVATMSAVLPCPQQQTVVTNVINNAVTTAVNAASSAASAVFISR